MSTPWSSSGSLPSDRIKPKSQSQSQKKQKQKQKPGAQPGIPKSKRLTALESLLHALQTTPNPLADPKGGCFCQAKEHPLSRYTPACTTCGLVLCALNAPQHACPHCHHAPPSRNREAVILKVQREVEVLVRKEEEERERAREAMGAFPALAGGGGGRATPPPSEYKVLSVNSKTKKVKVTVSTPVASRPGTPEPLRVPPPPTEVIYAKREVDASRPFANYVGETARYVK